jgi:hypothetical protein
MDRNGVIAALGARRGPVTAEVFLLDLLLLVRPLEFVECGG